ncbi:MAG: MbnP family protein [Candidatus Kapaibacterium sp.]
MKKSLLLAWTMALLACSGMTAQTKSVSLHINHLLNGTQFSTIFPASAPGGYYFRVSSLRYYLSKIRIKHDGGKIDEATGLYILVNPEANNEYILGNFDITNVEAIELGIGIDSATNHLDPTTYPKGDPLAMQDPTMHWGWNAGYRFIAFNGLAGASNSNTQTSFEIHALEDILYSSVTVPTKGTMVNGNLIITLDAEYSNLLINIDAHEGVVSHSSTGASATMMNNMVTSVFSAPKSSAVQEISEKPLAISPNPATHTLTISGVTPSNQSTLTITDMLGQIVVQRHVSETAFSLPLDLPLGTYVVSVQNGTMIQREKLVITE